MAAVTPVTNPVVTPMCNAMFALKGQNAIIVAPHPRAQKTNKYVIDLFRAELKKLGLPEDLVQTAEQCSMDATTALMHGVDVVAATRRRSDGEVRVLRRASPRSALVHGNVQVIVDRGVDLEEAVPKIISGRIFDNGIICSGEQCVFLPEESFEKGIDIFRKNGVFYVDDAETAKKFADGYLPGERSYQQKGRRSERADHRKAGWR